MSQKYNVIGSRLPRVEGDDKVTGRARYSHDIQITGMLYGKVLRSPHAHACIQSIDTSEAEAMPGVYAVITAADLGIGTDRNAQVGETSVNFKHQSDNTLASDKVLYVGHPVAAVAARTPEIADVAMNAIRVDYEVLPAVVDMMEAIQPGAPVLHEAMQQEDSAYSANLADHFQHIKGDPEKAFAEADIVVEREFHTKMVHQGYLETHGAVATWFRNGTVEIYTTTQGAFSVRNLVAELLHIPLSQVKVIPTEVGGAFGGKNISYVDVIATLLSRKAGARPVRVIMSRYEAFTATGPSSGTVIRAKLGATKDGKLIAAKAELYYEAGAYPGSPVGSGANVIFAPYDIPNGQLDGFDIVVNKPQVASYRAPGGTPASFAGEALIDELAEKLDMDPVDFRMLNCTKEGVETINGGVQGNIGAMEVLQALKAHPHLDAPLDKNTGRGIAFAYWGNWGARSSVNLTVRDDGSLSMTMGSVDITGARTVIAMQAAEALQLPYDQIKPSMADTDSVGYADTSGGSRTTMATGVAAVKAAEAVITQMKERAAMLLELPAEAIDYGNGIFCNLDNPDYQVTFDEVAAQLAETGGTVTGVGNVNVRQWGAGFGAHIADVHVDPETGLVTLKRYSTIQDVGKAINPNGVEGQIQGGAVQGIGWALYEGYTYADNGQQLNPSLMDYKLPTALDLPSIDVQIIEVPYPGHPYGVRGVGEVPIMPPPGAIANAIYRVTGARLTDTPMTPTHILEQMGVIS